MKKQLITVFMLIAIPALAEEAVFNLDIDENIVKDVKNSISKEVSNTYNLHNNDMQQKLCEEINQKNYNNLKQEMLKDMNLYEESVFEESSSKRDIYNFVLSQFETLINFLEADEYNEEAVYNSISVINYYLANSQYEDRIKYSKIIGVDNKYFIKSKNQIVNMAYLIKGKKNDLKGNLEEEDTLFKMILKEKPYNQSMKNPAQYLHLY